MGLDQRGPILNGDTQKICLQVVMQIAFLVAS